MDILDKEGRPLWKPKDPADDGPEVNIIRREHRYSREDHEAFIRDHRAFIHKVVESIRDAADGGPFGITARAYGIAEFRDDESGLPPVSSVDDHFDMGGES